MAELANPTTATADPITKASAVVEGGLSGNRAKLLDQCGQGHLKDCVGEDAADKLRDIGAVRYTSNSGRIEIGLDPTRSAEKRSIQIPVEGGTRQIEFNKDQIGFDVTHSNTGEVKATNIKGVEVSLDVKSNKEPGIMAASFSFAEGVVAKAATGGSGTASITGLTATPNPTTGGAKLTVEVATFGPKTFELTQGAWKTLQKQVPMLALGGAQGDKTPI